MMLWFNLGIVFLVCLVTGLVMAKYGKQMKLLAMPGEHRQHQQATPMVGGIAMYLGLLAGLILVDSSYSMLLACLFFICAIGVLDDRYALPSWSRFLAQALAVYFMVKLTGVQLHSLGYIVSNQDLLLGKWSIPMTIFAGIGVINALNMSDGLDGLAGSTVFIALLALLLIGSDHVGLILVSLFSLAGFLVLNLRIGRPQAKIFMGDAGSTMLGLLVAYLLIQYSQVDNGIWPVTALWFIALPLIDAVSVLLVRPLRGRSPFAADRIHYHHKLRDRGLSVNSTLAVALAVQIVFIVLGVFLWKIRVDDKLQLAAFLLIFIVYCINLYRFAGKRSNQL